MRHYDFTFDFALKLPLPQQPAAIASCPVPVHGYSPLISIPTCKKPSKRGVLPRWEAAPGRGAPAQSAARSSQPLSTPNPVRACMLCVVADDALRLIPAVSTTATSYKEYGPI